MLRFSTSRFVAVVSFATVVGASTYAVNLVSGTVALGGVNSGVLPALTGGTLLASTSQNFLTTAWGGTLYTAVIQETNGNLAFLYQVQNVKPGTKHTNWIPRMTVVDYTGSSTNVDYFSNAFTGFGFIAPTANSFPFTADRNSPDTIGFEFAQNLDLGLINGDTSNVVYILTNAREYTRGRTNFIDGAVADVPSFAPVAVPGPMALLPFAVGFAASLIRRRK